MYIIFFLFYDGQNINYVIFISACVSTEDSNKNKILLLRFLSSMLISVKY